MSFLPDKPSTVRQSLHRKCATCHSRSHASTALSPLWNTHMHPGHMLLPCRSSAVMRHSALQNLRNSPSLKKTLFSSGFSLLSSGRRHSSHEKQSAWYV